jgi:hypothetical protein
MHDASCASSMGGSLPMSARISAALLALLLLTVPTICTAAEHEFDLRGYLKSFLTAGKTLFDEAYYLVTHRLRLNAVYYPVPQLELRAILDNQLTWGSYLDTAQYALSRPYEDRSYIDMTLDPYESDDARWRVEVHRLYLRYSNSKLDLAVGRQRIAWGSGRIWNPTDLFNPTSPLSLEPAEKNGADAVYLAVRPVGNLQLEAAWAIGSDSSDTRWATRARTSIGSYEIYLMGGRFRDSDVLGFDFSGYIGDAGFRGEFTHSWEPDRQFTRGVLSYEYTFPGGTDLLVEYLFNGGNIEQFDLNNIKSLAVYDSIVTLNRQFLAVSLSKQLHPLITGQMLSIFELEDGSIFLFPFITYSWAQNVDLTLGAQFFLGDKGDFSLYHPTALAALEWYF